MDLTLLPLAIAVGLLAVMLLATETGYRLGRRRAADDDKSVDMVITTVLSATLGLVGLLLGFSFAAAGSRFIDRMDVIVRESNAIGTAYLRTDLLDEPYRGTCRRALRDYTATRIELFGEWEAEKVAPIRARSEALQNVFWKAAIDGVRKEGKFDETVLPPMNEVIDLHTTRHAMEHRHIPVLVFSLLIACTAVALSALGYGCGKKGRRHWASTSSLGLLLAAVLWIVLDLDYPRAGLLQINQDPMIALMESLKANP
jgi:hypothetical protein